LFPNKGDGYVTVIDSSGSSDYGHLILHGGKENFGAVWQKLNLKQNKFTTVEFAFKNYLGSQMPKGTVLEFRLENDSLPGGPSQVIYTHEIKDTASSWLSILKSIELSPNPEYKYLVVCVRNDDLDWLSVIGLDNLVLCTDVISDVDQLDAKKEWTIYPNPTTGDVTLKFNGSTPSSGQVYIMDVTGKIMNRHVFSPYNKEQIISLSTYASGVYLLRIVDGNGTAYYKKVIKVE
jgi:Secretion system C-terminal sorting domain